MPRNVYTNFTRPRIFPTWMMKTLACTQNKRRAEQNRDTYQAAAWLQLLLAPFLTTSSFVAAL